MIELVFATNNKHKIEEIKNIINNEKYGLKNKFKILSLNDIGCFDDIAETSDTFHGNASQKAKFIVENYAYNCFADDSGLEIDALEGRPGIRSARYAGENSTQESLITKVLSEMQGIKNRKANFKTVVSLIIDGKENFFEGIVNGSIRESPVGTNGFGYDPIFQPDNYNITFAQMELNEKNKISHRARAVGKLIDYLQTL
ncbi:MAG: RdgB/HAM1 family non-canonical purine NTP pyrophosphatase [Saprospiraceae bacterium]|nr:RdgB/HAM1 family non-canonical purine NTP pyrophosphatase [Saprospiraceae bacterium]